MTLGDADDGMRIVIGGFGRFVFAGTALAGQLIHTERVVDVMRVGSYWMAVRGRAHVMARGKKVLSGPEAAGPRSRPADQRVDRRFLVVDVRR